MDRNLSLGKWRAAGLLGGIAIAVAGCVRHEAPDPEKRYPLHGEVMAVDARRHVVTVAHEAVPGLMPAMTMEFPVSAGQAAVLHTGEFIRAELVIERPGAEPRLDGIWPDDPAAAAAVAAGERALREDTHDRGDQAYREVGEGMPDFTLYDQDGRVVSSGRFRGKQIMLNFIYTRCPLANMCPLSTAKMREAQERARDQGIRNIEFVSITLDPHYDTPGVLKDYALDRGIDTRNFSFLTGPDGAVRDLLTQFGVIADFSGGVAKHTLVTLLIDAKGKIIWRADGSAWEPAEFVARMHRS
jgi:protein SCO1/2